MNNNKILVFTALAFLFSAVSAFAGEVSGVINNAIVIGSPSSTVVSGKYDSIQTIELSVGGAKEIRYTLNGDSPSCASGELYSRPIIIDHTLTLKGISCYADGTSSSVSEYNYEINLPRNSGGGGSPSGSFPIKKEIPNGEVLGAMTSYDPSYIISGSCARYINSYVVFSYKNNRDDVIKLQKFLNRELSVTIPLTGYFGPLTRSYVIIFQDKYHNEILGKDYKGKGTGNVYQMTRNMIDKVECARKIETAKAK